MVCGGRCEIAPEHAAIIDGARIRVHERARGRLRGRAPAAAAAAKRLQWQQPVAATHSCNLLSDEGQTDIGIPRLRRSNVIIIIIWEGFLYLSAL